MKDRRRGSALLACALAVPAHAEDCKHTAHRTANSAGPDIERVVIEAGAGDLVVRGGEGRDVTVEGRACASTAELLDGSKLEIRRDGNTVYVRTVLPEISGCPVRLRALCIHRRDGCRAEDRDAQDRRFERRHAT